MSKLNFLYKTNELQNIAEKIINRSLSLGATSAQVELSEHISTSIEILNGDIENSETSHQNQVTLAIFSGHKKGCVGISDIAMNNIDNFINQALDIAKYTQEDESNGILEQELSATELHGDLGLYFPPTASLSEIIKSTKEIESIALNIHPDVNASNGSATSLSQYNFVIANSNGFNLGYNTSRYHNSISLIGKNKHGMQTDYWYSGAREYTDLATPSEIAHIAAHRVQRRLDKGTIKASSPKIIFESNIAKSMISGLIGALSGNSQYRQLSFLNNSLGQKVLPEWITITENPFVFKGLSSCHFDNEGCKVAERNIIENGVITGYVLSRYSAKKLGMKSTGNSGGTHNLHISNNFIGGITELAKEAVNGLIVIETIGHGLNTITGDYSVGATGLLVENGNITKFVEEITISGNIKTILENIIYIANDSTAGGMNCGSMLIDSDVIHISTK